MTPPLAIRLLAALRRSDGRDALVGDLLEEHGRRRSAAWLWKQVIVAAVVSPWQRYAAPNVGLDLLHLGHPDRQGVIMMLFAFLKYLWRWKWRVVAAAVVVGAASYGASGYFPKVYRSTAIIQIVPPRVPDAVIASNLMALNLTDRLPAIQQQVMSRTKLERIIVDLDLYPVERQHGIMDDVVGRLRQTVTVRQNSAESFSVSAVSDTPRIAQQLAERISSLLMDEATTDQATLMEGTDQFIETQVEDLGTRIIALQRQLAEAKRKGSDEIAIDGMQLDVLSERYRALLGKQTDARMTSNLEKRQIGQQFKIVDEPRLPVRPETPDRVAYAVDGAAGGLLLGIVLVLRSFIRRMSRPSPPALQTEIVPAE